MSSDFTWVCMWVTLCSILFVNCSQRSDINDLKERVEALEAKEKKE